MNPPSEKVQRLVLLSLLLASDRFSSAATHSHNLSSTGSLRDPHNEMGTPILSNIEGGSGDKTRLL